MIQTKFYSAVFKLADLKGYDDATAFIQTHVNGGWRVAHEAYNSFFTNDKNLSEDGRAVLVIMCLIRVERTIQQ